MRRVRIVFAVLSLVLLGAAGLLVQRALASARAERVAQRSTLAARVFDEMERALSSFLDAEESRSFGGWLSVAAADPPFVLARFELGPGGGMRLSAGAPPDTARLVEAWAARRAAPREPEPRERAMAGGADQKKLAAEAQEAPEIAPSPAPKAAQDSLYGALQSLNRGAEGRAQRVRKLETAAEPAAPALMAELPAAVSPAQIVVDPLLGDRLGKDQLLLVRTVLAGDRGHRQGLVLSAGALGDWLRARGLGDDALPGAAIAFAAGASARAAPASTGAFLHRFAEPFDALEAELVLPPLPDAGNADTVLRLSLLLVVAAGAALFALYRMVAVALRYAEQRSNFVAAVSHELKTPLTAIRMYGEMLRDGLVPGEEKRAEYYRTITAESERLSRLIDNVLEFARGERGEAPLALRAGSLASEVATLCDALRPHAAESGFTLELLAAPDVPAASFDRDAVAQILVNLVDNALKYARGAGRRVVQVTCAAEEGGVALRVRDFGPGVPARDLARVFELFQRGESELTRTTRGSGLGLALVRSLARRMHARVSAHNAEGGGFEVVVVFPQPVAA